MSSTQKMLSVCQTNCDYVTVGREPVIHSFGRSPRNVFTRLHFQIHGFEPYFYIDKGFSFRSERVKRAYVDQQYQFSLDGRPVKRIVTFLPGDVSDLRSHDLSSIQTYQSKVLFPINFMCSNGIKSGFSVSLSDLASPQVVGVYVPNYLVGDYKRLVPNNDVYVDPLTLMLDIETNNSVSNPDIGNPDQEVTMTTFKDSYTKYQYTFAWHPKVSTKSVKNLTYHYDYSNIDMNWKILAYGDEYEMLENMYNFMLKVQPDIYTGWNVNFDMVYLLGRMRKLGFDIRRLSPVGEARITPIKDRETDVVKGYRPVLKGVSIVDMLLCYKNIVRFDGMKPSYALDDVGDDECDLKKLRYDGTVGKLWMDEFSKCIKYNARDIEICYEINRKKKVMQYQDMVRRQTGCSFEDTVFTSRIIETEVLRKAMSIGKVVKTVIERPKTDKFRGAVVFPPTVGKHHNVLMFDLKSLYPSIIMTLNISPETRVENPTQYTAEQLSQFIKSAVGVYYRKDITGFAKECLMDMNKHRDMFKSCVLAVSDILKQEEVSGAIFGDDNSENIQKNILSILTKNKYSLSREVTELVGSKIKETDFTGKTKDQIIRFLKSEETNYDLMQKAEKAKINTWYGVMGKEGSSLSNIQDAESVTMTGREIIEFSAKVVMSDEMSKDLKEKFGIDASPRLIYGDTDSIYIAGFESVTDFQQMTKISDFVGKFITKSYDAFCKQKYNADVHYLKIRCEEVAKVFCMSPRKKQSKKEEAKGAKKRYWYLPWGTLEGDKGWIEYNGDTDRETGKVKYEIEIVGFEAKRSNVAKIGRVVQRRVMEFITFDKPTSFIRAYIKSVISKIEENKYSLEDLTFNTTVYAFDSYDAFKKGLPVSSWDEHVRAAKWGNDFLHQNWRPGDKVKVIYVNKSPACKKIVDGALESSISEGDMDVVAIERGKLPKGFAVDYQKVFEKQVRDNLTAVLATRGWTFNSIMSAMQVGNL